MCDCYDIAMMNKMNLVQATGLTLAVLLGGCSSALAPFIVNETEYTQGLYNYYQWEVMEECDKGESVTQSDLIVKSVAQMKHTAYIDEQLDTQGKLSEEEKSLALEQAEKEWDVNKDTFKDLKITVKDISTAIETDLQSEKLFQSAIDGMDIEVTSDDIHAYMDEYVISVEYIEIPYVDNQGNPLSSEDIATNQQVAKELLQMLQENMSFIDILDQLSPLWEKAILTDGFMDSMIEFPIIGKIDTLEYTPFSIDLESKEVGSKNLLETKDSIIVYQRMEEYSCTRCLDSFVDQTLRMKQKEQFEKQIAEQTEPYILGHDNSRLKEISMSP